ncbi:MAG: RNA polymerase sigma factor [Nocardioides sp.]
MVSIDTRGSVDQDRFGDVFFAHAARLVRLAALLGDEDPEDVVQEAFCKLYNARTRLRGPNPVPYLNRIIVNEVRDRHRRRGVARRDAHLLVAADVAPTGLDTGDREAVLDAMAALPRRQREALVLRYWLDLPLAEIAEAMGVRVGTVKSQISRGLDLLQATLDDPTEARR